MTKTEPDKTRTNRAKVSINPKPSIALVNKEPPISGAYDSDLSSAANINPTATAQPPNGIDVIDRAIPFIALMNIKKTNTPTTK